MTKSIARRTGLYKVVFYGSNGIQQIDMETIGLLKHCSILFIKRWNDLVHTGNRKVEKANLKENENDAKSGCKKESSNLPDRTRWN